MLILLGIGGRVTRVVTFDENFYLLLASLKYVTFVTTPPKVVTISLDHNNIYFGLDLSKYCSEIMIGNV